MCQILPKGVVSVIGPASSPASGSTVSHICGEKEVRMKGSAFAYVSVRAFPEMINLHCSSATGHYFLCAFALLLEKHLSLWPNFPYFLSLLPSLWIERMIYQPGWLIGRYLAVLVPTQPINNLILRKMNVLLILFILCTPNLYTVWSAFLIPNFQYNLNLEITK